MQRKLEIEITELKLNFFMFYVVVKFVCLSTWSYTGYV